MNMNIKLTPLSIFVLLLFLLIFSIIFKNEINYLIPEKWNISEAIFSNNQSSWYNMVEGLTCNTNTIPRALNVSAVYDISKTPVETPIKSKIYYDISGRVINFPDEDIVYDEIGNIIKTPPLVGFMYDRNYTPLNTYKFYDKNGKLISDNEFYNTHCGPVYDQYNNVIGFPYLDSGGNMDVTYNMSPDLLKKYDEYINNKAYSGDISCPIGVNYDQPLDNYISEYYQHFWNQHKQMYSDDYVLKSSIPSVPNTQCNANTNNWNMLYGSNSLGSNIQNSLTQTGQNVKAVVDGVGDTIGDIGSGAQKAATTVGGNVKDVVAEVGDTIGDIGSTAYKAVSTVGGDIKSAAKEVGSGVSSALKTEPTQIHGQYTATGAIPTIANTKGLAGNYTGDNSTNMGYMKGTNQFSNYSTTDGAANFSNNYNATPMKSSDFIPVTADFSKFGR